MNGLFRGVFDTEFTAVITLPVFLGCMAVALIIGAWIALVYSYKSRYTKSFLTTLALLPAIVCVVIMMVNGNVGTGVAVTGAFSLVRFRSVPGTAKEIGTIFLAMSAGLAVGIGYLGYAVLFSLIVGLVMIFYAKIGFGEQKNLEKEKVLQITIPENLDYSGVFDDLFEQYTESVSMCSVKTSNMGSLFKLTYRVVLKDVTKEKEFIDGLRCRNGNLEISSLRQGQDMEDL